MKTDKLKKKKIIISVSIITLIICLFLIWIIYFFTKKNNGNNIVKDSFISNVYVDDNFSNNTNSYIYATDNPDNSYGNYQILNYNGEELLKVYEPYFSLFHPYYYDNEIGFTWFKINKYDSYERINFYKIADLNDYNDYINGYLKPFAYYDSDYNNIFSHEYYYDPYNDYIFIIDNLNGWDGYDTSDNGGLGLPSIQKIIAINCKTNEYKEINISELLNYDYNDWYYIDEENNYYRTLMPTNDFFHFNSLDFDGENIYANSRTLGTIFSFKVIDDNGNFLEKPEINWIYSGNFSGYYYYYPTDIDGDSPLIYDFDNKKYVSNLNYDAQETYNYHKINNGLQDKFINWEINGNYYSSSNLEELQNAQKEYENELFMGEHCVKLLNPYIEEIGAENFFTDQISYDPNDLYFSMFDNHAEQAVTALKIHEKGIDDNYPTFDDDDSSYMKIIELNPTQNISKTKLEPMTARVIFNHPTQQQSNIISSLLFFNENSKNYVVADQGYTRDLDESYQSRLTIYQFDKIDTYKKDFNNFNIVYDINFDSEYVYRSYSVWKNLNNVFLEWF